MISMRTNAGRGPMSQPAMVSASDVAISSRIRGLEDRLAKAEERNSVLAKINEGLRSRLHRVEQTLGLTRNSKVIERRRLICGEIIRITAKVNFSAVGEIMGSNRCAPLQRCRHIAALIMRDELGMSTPEIARAMGRQDHSTAISWLRTARKQMRRSTVFAERHEECVRQFAEVDLAGLSDG